VTTDWEIFGRHWYLAPLCAHKALDVEQPSWTDGRDGYKRDVSDTTGTFHASAAATPQHAHLGPMAIPRSNQQPDPKLLPHLGPLQKTAEQKNMMR